MTAAFRFTRLDGKSGSAVIRGLGSRVGEVAAWSLSRRDEGDPAAGLFDLRVVFSVVSPALLTDPDYNEDREVLLTIAKGRTIRVRLDDPAKMVVQGKILFMEGVAAEWSSK